VTEQGKIHVADVSEIEVVMNAAIRHQDEYRMKAGAARVVSQAEVDSQAHDYNQSSTRGTERKNPSACTNTRIISRRIFQGQYTIHAKTKQIEVSELGDGKDRHRFIHDTKACTESVPQSHTQAYAGVRQPYLSIKTRIILNASDFLATMAELSD